MTFYDELADYYHYIYDDWEASIERQSMVLHSIIGGAPRVVADVAAGIGTQSLGLAARGYQVIATDLSSPALERLQREAGKRGLSIESRIDDMARLSTYADHSVDVLIACDNAVPHLLTDDAIHGAFTRFRQVLRPGGLCILSVRDYAAMPEARVRLVPFGAREGGRVAVFQVWVYEGACYDLRMYLVFDDGDQVETKVFRSRYYAVSIDTLMRLMREAGFEDVHRVDDRFFQPLIVASC